MKYNLEPSKRFGAELKKLIKSGRLSSELIRSKFKALENNPFDKSLRTHKVISKSNGLAYSSRVTNDLRIIWNFDSRRIKIIIIYDIGGHSGNKSVYK